MVKSGKRGRSPWTASTQSLTNAALRFDPPSHLEPQWI